MKRIEPKRKIIAQLALDGCPEGDVLAGKPNLEVDAFFEGWTNALTPHAYWNMPSNMHVIHEDGQSVLEHPAKDDRCLVAGELSWRDYTIESRVKIMCAETAANMDNDVHIVPWAGMMFRYRDLRHYYFFCLQPRTGFVLYRRADDDWHVLAEVSAEIDLERYYNLTAKVVGSRIHCYADDEEIICLADYVYRAGKAGLRFNTHARADSVAVTMTHGEEKIFFDARSRYERELAELAEKYPQPVEWKRVDLQEYFPFGLIITELSGKDTKDFILLTNDGRIIAMDIDGEVIWERDCRMSIPMLDSASMNLIGIVEGRITVLNARTGETLKQRPLPTIEGRDLVFRYSTQSLMNLRGTETPQDYVLRQGDDGDTLWAYDDNLDLMWRATVKPNFGHGSSVGSFDVDGDGREEVLAGGTLLNGEGKTLWRVEDYEGILRKRGGHHIDAVAIGNFADDAEVDPIAFLMAGSAGVYVVDALTGRLRDVHRVGHAQGRNVGNFRADVPGLEILVGCRWGNYGILNYFSGRGERLISFEPDNISQGGPPVNWTGDGEELMLLATSHRALGMYDGYGRKVVNLPKEHLPDKIFYGRGGWCRTADVCGDPRDELIFVAGGIMRIFTQDNSLPSDTKIYAPSRRHNISHPAWQFGYR